MYPSAVDVTEPSRKLKVAVANALLALTMAIAATPPLAAQDIQSADLLRRATTWGYQLQNIDASKLDTTDHDVLVVDAGSGDGEWGLSRGQISKLRTKPNGSRRIVLAYMNIGEAEDYRYYWKKAWNRKPPTWMGSENCRWQGDHRVRHWMAEWQAILFGTKQSYLGRLIDAGYDGVYLDRVDIYYHWRPTRWQAATEMVDLVSALSRWAKSRRPGFLIVPQNGEELLSEPRYRAAIDAIGKEDMLFGDRGNNSPNASDRIARAVRNFAPARKSGLPVFSVEYATNKKHHEEIRARHSQLGFTLYFGPRSLAYLGQDGPRHAEDSDTETALTEETTATCE